MRIALTFLALVPLAACSSTGDASSESSAIDLGGSSHWRGWNKADVPDAWVIEDGVIHLTGGGGGDLITREMYDSFILELSWRISPGGNSGILFHATEEGGAIYESAPEMQVLDDAANPTASPLHMSGANYGLHPTKPVASRPAGEWNEIRLTVDGARVTHEQNGVELLTYELWSPEWEALVAGSKFAQWPIYGRAKSGHIGLQDHGNEVWFKDVRITPLN